MRTPFEISCRPLHYTIDLTPDGGRRNADLGKYHGRLVLRL